MKKSMSVNFNIFTKKSIISFSGQCWYIKAYEWPRLDHKQSQ